MIDRQAVAVSMLTLLLGTAILLVVGTGAVAGEDCETVTASTVIEESGCYELTGDLVVSEPIAIKITASDVVLDGNGHELSRSSASYGDAGVYVADGVTNITVKNVDVVEFNDRIYIGGDDGRVENVNTDVSSGGIGLNVTGSNVTLENNAVQGSPANGVGYRIEGSDNTLRNNEAFEGEFGYRINGSNNTLTGDVATGNDFFLTIGVEVGPNASNVTLQDVTVANWTRGIYHRGDDGRIDNATAVAEYQTGDGKVTYGITVFGANNTVTNSTATSEQAFRVAGTNNTLSNNLGLSGVGFIVSGDQNWLENNVVDHTETAASPNAFAIDGDHNTLYNNTATDAVARALSITGDRNNITDNFLTGAYGAGSGAIHLFEAENNTLVGNNVSDARQYGIELTRSHNTTIRDTIAENVTEYLSATGIYVSDSRDLVIENASVIDAGDHGIWLGGADRSLVSNVTANNTAGHAIRIGGSPGVTLRSATVSGSVETGIYVSGSDGATLDGNLVEGTEEDGIQIEGGSNVTLENNVVRQENDFIYAIRIVNAVEPTVANNTVNDTWFGIHLSSAPGASVTDNLVFDVEEDGIYINEATGGLVAENKVFTVGGRGIYVDSTEDAEVADNEISDTDSYGSYLYNATNVTVTGNEVTGVQFSGMYLSDGLENTVVGNRIVGSGSDGIELSSSVDNLIYDNYLNNTNNVDATYSDGNTWNVSKQSGTNVVGGPYLGGNYYAKPAGNGFSETCTDADGDGLCDTEFAHDVNDVDYLPLVLGGDGSEGGDGDDGDSQNVTANATVLSSSIGVANGTMPDLDNVTLDVFYTGGLLQVQLTNGTAPQDDLESRYELAGVGADATTVFELEIKIENATPRVLVGAGNVSSWAVAPNGDGTTNVTITTRPIEVQSIFDDGYEGGTPDLEDWPEGENDTATEKQDAAVMLAVDSVSFMDATQANQLNGTILATDAQAFGSPQYTPASGGQPPELSLFVAGPHNRTDGTLNQGFYDALLPKSLLDAWGITDPENELTAAYDGQPAAIEVNETVVGDVWVAIDIHYSAGEVSVSAQADDGGDGGSGGDDGSTSPGPSDDEPSDTETTTPPPTTATTPTSTTTPEETSPETTETPSPAGEETPPSTSDPTQSTQAPATTSSPGQPGFGVVVTALALLAAALVAGRRR